MMSSRLDGSPRFSSHVRLGVLLAAMVMVAEIPAHADTVVLPAVADTGLREIVPDQSGGADLGLRAGTTGLAVSNLARALFLFDPAAAIPSGSTIVSVRLTLSASMTTDTLAREFELRRMLVAWSETGSTWNLRLPPGTSWFAPGGAEGVDYSASPSHSILVGGPGLYTWGSATGMVADVQRWLDNPAKNFGWMLRRSEETAPRTARLFNSRENTNSPPQLVVEFNPQFRITSAEIAGAQICLRFLAVAGKRYTVERRDHADSGEWMTVTNLPVAEMDGPVVVCDPLVPENRFYRVGVE